MAGGLFTRLPSGLAELLAGYSYNRHPYVESQAEIYVLCNNEQRLYLKIRADSTMRLEKEYQMLKWINQRIPVPEPIYYLKEKRGEYLLTSEITGTPTYQVATTEREQAVRVLAETLCKIHGLNPIECPVSHSIDDWISYLNEKQIDTSSLGPRPSEELVFTHGDYCLPNIIVKEGGLSGVIDWDYAGLADPYADLASCAWSLGYNYKEDADNLIPLFYETYGVEIDEEKLSYYRRLYELIP